MKHNISKYDSTCLFPSGSKEKWEGFLESFEVEYGNMSQDPVWVPDQIKQIQDRCPNIAVPTVNQKIVDKAVAEKKSRKVCNYRLLMLSVCVCLSNNKTCSNLYCTYVTS